MKFLNVPISVEAHKGVPRRLRWGRRIYTVRRLLDFWILQSRWWAREEKRVYFRLETDRGMVEVYRGEEEREEKEEEKEERRGPHSGPTHGAKRSREEGEEEEGGEEEEEKASKTHQGGHPPFIEGDTHTREVRQTESPYRPDAGRRINNADGSISSPSSFREPDYRWVLSKVID